MQYREAYEKGKSILKGIPDAELDARLLLEEVCHTNVQTLLAHPETAVSEDELRAYLSMVNQRKQRKPLAYILGKQEFMGLFFKVTPDVLIPNQDTENLVEEALRQLDDRSRILDLCTGSGCILLSLLHYSNHCVGVGTDISDAALKVAAQNAQVLGLEGSSFFLRGDLFEALFQTNIGTATERGKNESGPARSEDRKNNNDLTWKEDVEKEKDSERITDRMEQRIPEKFDLIVSNPPYIPTAVIDTLEPEVRTAEPKLALDGGRDGLNFYRRIADGAMDYLVIGGALMMEIGFDQAASVTGILRDCGYSEIEVFQDYGGNDRIVRAVRPLTSSSLGT